MSKDYYKILGLEKGATQDEIKKAFRKAALKHHPDQGGDEKEFKEVNEAYTVLGDEKKRAQFDQFGAAGPGGQGFDFSGFDFSSFGFGGGQNADFDLNDILGQVFGGGFRRQRKGQNIQVDVDLNFKESVLGVKKKISFYKNKQDKETGMEVTIPGGVSTGEMLKVSREGEPVDGGIPGDLYVRIHVTEPKDIKKHGIHLVQNLDLNISEAVLGTKKDIETVDGHLKIKIPQGSKTGDILKVRGEGIQASPNRRGDMLVALNISIPKKINKKARKLLEELKKEGL
jgi:DnaJ-class molecular chaperone